MNVTIINGSPNNENGSTSYVLAPLIKGMELAGASVEIIYTSNLDLKPCIGCLKCWHTHVEKCFIKDDMQEIYPKLKKTDILIIATPVYIKLPGMLQIFLNRILPLIKSKLEFRNGRTRAKFHDDVHISKILAVVVGGWWEKENSNIVVNIVEDFSKTASTEFLGAIRRPQAKRLKENTEMNAQILAALQSLGHKMIEKGTIDEDKLEFVSQPLGDSPNYVKV